MPTWHDVFAAGIDHSAAAGHDQIGAHLPAQSNIKHNQKKKTKKVPSRIQKILHLVSGTTRFHSNNSDSIFVNEKRFLRLFWFCFGFFLGFFFLVFKARRLRNRFGFAGRTWWCHLQCRCPRPRCRRRWPPCRVGSAADSGRSVKTQKNRFNRLHFDDFLYFFQSIRWKHVRVAGFHGNESDRIFTAVIRIKQFRFYRFVLPSFFYWVLPSFEKFSLKNPILEPVLLVLFFLFFEIEFCQCNLRFYRIDLICWKTEPVLLFIYLFFFLSFGILLVFITSFLHGPIVALQVCCQLSDISLVGFRWRRDTDLTEVPHFYVLYQFT